MSRPNPWSRQPQGGGGVCTKRTRGRVPLTMKHHAGQIRPNADRSDCMPCTQIRGCRPFHSVRPPHLTVPDLRGTGGTSGPNMPLASGKGNETSLGTSPISRAAQQCAAAVVLRAQ